MFILLVFLISIEGKKILMTYMDNPESCILRILIRFLGTSSPVQQDLGCHNSFFLFSSHPDKIYRKESKLPMQTIRHHDLECTRLFILVEVICNPVIYQQNSTSVASYKCVVIFLPKVKG